MNPFNTSREIAAPVEKVFAAMTDPARLARWWGPAGFTNTFTVCELRKGGRWVFTMHGPDGVNYPNESLLEEFSPAKVVVRHVSKPNYRLTITLAPTKTGTRVTWSQLFDEERVAKAIERIVVPANEENLDRLSAEVLGRSA